MRHGRVVFVAKVIRGGRYFLLLRRFRCWLAASSARVSDIIRGGSQTADVTFLRRCQTHTMLKKCLNSQLKTHVGEWAALKWFTVTLCNM